MPASGICADAGEVWGGVSVVAGLVAVGESVVGAYVVGRRVVQENMGTEALAAGHPPSEWFD